MGIFRAFVIQICQFEAVESRSFVFVFVFH